MMCSVMAMSKKNTSETRRKKEKWRRQVRESEGRRKSRAEGVRLETGALKVEMLDEDGDEDGGDVRFFSSERTSLEDESQARASRRVLV